ncbi:MAG: PIN domain-containing protein [Caldilineaceae bacterium]|nr:PIN domain-containing protein [Caldilineaceae bacterium]MCB0106493.1 PIN domain-containing protein [Caldilineaceae bacterium]
MTAVADTGFILAVAVRADAKHAACLSIYRSQSVIYLPQSTLAEVAYLLTRAGGNEATAHFLDGLPRTKYRLVALEDDDVARVAQLLKQYAMARIDFVDMTVVAIAERLEIRRILTVDQRDFRMVRPTHCPYLEILP